MCWKDDHHDRSMCLTYKIKLGKDRRKRVRQRMRCLDSIIDSVDMSLSKLREMVRGREAWGATVHESANSQT